MRTIAGRVQSLAVGVTAVTLLLGLQVHGWRQAPAQGAKPAGQGGQESAPPPKPTGIILGQVVDAAGAKPIAGATVTINGSVQPVVLSNGDLIMPPPAAAGGPAAAAAPTAPRQVMTSASGAFMFRELGKGRYTMRVTSPGYLPGSHGQSKPGGASQSIELLQEDERRDGFVIRMWKSASLSGTIVDEANEPVIGYVVRVIRRVMVAGKPRLSPGTTTTTDDRGAYRVSGITPGDYLVGVMLTQTTMPVATSEAYFQQMMAGGSSLNSEIYRELSSSGAPSGMMSGYRVGDLMLESGMSGRGGSGGALIPPPGDDGKVLAYPTQFYPASRLASQATVITLASGQDRSGIDFQMKLVPAFRVSGIVMGPDGPARNLGIKLFPVGADEFTSESGVEAAATATDATGAFTFLGVTPGDYTLKCLRMPRPLASNSPAMMTMVEVMGANGSFMSIGTSGPNTAPPPPLPTELTLWATTSVSVSDSDVAGLSVALHAGARISGRLVFEGTKEPPGPDQLQRASIQINPVSGSTPIQILTAAKRVETDGRFSSIGYPPGRYTVGASVQSAPPVAGAPPVMSSWTLKSAVFGGHDVSDEGLAVGADDVAGIVITFTDRQTELTGTVRGDKGQPDTTASVIVLPADSQVWRQGVMNVRRLRNVRTTTTGAFTVAGLPPGDYLVAAVNEDGVSEWQDPKFLEKVAAVAVRVTVGDGEKKSQELATKTIR